METPQTANGQFVDSVLMNGVVSTLMGSMTVIGKRAHTAGLFNPSSLTITPNNLVLTISAPLPFLVLFGNGSFVPAHGTTNYADTQTYTVNMASLVPGSGSVTAYVVAQQVEILQSLTTIIGPPPGHPDYDPTFAPFEFGETQQDSLSFTATTTPPDNSTTFEICRVTLNAGQITILSNAINTSNWHYGSAVLNPTGVTAGNYPGATVTVGTDGRITGISTVAYGPLAGNNTWTGTNTFDTRTYFGTSGQFYIDPNQVGEQVVNFAAGQFLGFIPGTGFNFTTTGEVLVTAPGGVTIEAGTTVQGPLVTTQQISAQSGNIAALGGHLTASAGAFNSGNSAAATILSDFLFSEGTTATYMRLPNGYIIQTGTGTSTAGISTVTFADPFPTGCLFVMASTAGPGGWANGDGSISPTIFGTQQPTATNFVLYGAKQNGAGSTGWVLTGSLAFWYIAIGI